MLDEKPDLGVQRFRVDLAPIVNRIEPVSMDEGRRHNSVHYGNREVKNGIAYIVEKETIKNVIPI